MKNLILIKSNSFEPEFNISLDEMMLFLAGKGVLPDIIRFYKNSHSVILGRFQRREFEVDEDYCRQNSIKIVKRISGGGAVFHDQGNLNIALTVPERDLPCKNVLDNMFLLSSAIANALRYFGIEAYVGEHSEILVKGKKVSGCAVSIKSGGFLYHSTLLLNSDLEKMKRALTPKREYEPTSKLIKSNRVSTINIYELKYIREEDLTQRIYFEIKTVLI
jgi:lipoate-protein ligase A